MRFLILFLILFYPLIANEYVVVVSQQTPIHQISKSLLKDIYLKKKGFILDIKIVPINLLTQHAIRSKFEDAILGMDRDELNNYWIEQHYHGVRPPITQKSPQSLKAFLNSVKGSIGYLPKEQVGDELRVIYEF